MGKPLLGGIMSRRKSSGNAMADMQVPLPQDETTPPPETSSSGGGGFRVLSQKEVERAKQEAALRKQQEKEKHKFGRFSGFGNSGNKARNHSFDDDSPASSKRDSKSSSDTKSSSSRPYNVGHSGSTSTLPSSLDTDLGDNMFSHAPPRPYISQHSSSPAMHTLSMNGMKKNLPAIPKSHTTDSDTHPGFPSFDQPSNSNRNRAMTASSYASTAMPPKLGADLDLGSDLDFGDDLFSGLGRRNSPDFTANNSAGRSLLAEKRTVHAEPLKIDSKLEVEPPLQSWDSRGSGEHLMPSPTSPADNDSPPPVPPHNHKFSQYTQSQYSQYAPVASQSPNLREPSPPAFEDADAKLVRDSTVGRYYASAQNSSPEQKPTSYSSSATSLQTPLSSRSASNTTTPKAAVRPAASPLPDDDEDNMFSPPKVKDTPVRKPAAVTLTETVIPPPPPPPGEPTRKVLTQAEFRAQQENQSKQPVEDSSDSEDDYEDEEEAIAKREAEALARRKQQQLQMAREHLRRSTTAPADPNRPASRAGTPSMGFPSETSLQAAEWEDEDVPLAILQAHGFPGRGKAPAPPVNAAPSYIRSSSSPNMPERPASAGAMSTRGGAAGYRPPFARNLPDDPYANVIGGGLVRPMNRESMGFSRGAQSVYGEPAGMPNMSMPLMGYPDQPQSMSLVDQIQLRDMSKPKYTGGAGSKTPKGGPFTGALGAQMNAMGQNNNPMRMSQMGMPGMGMNGMNMNMGMNGMNPMNGGMMGMQMGQPMMPMMNGMNQMGYPMQQQQQELMAYMQMQNQMMAQMQQQMGMLQQPGGMSMPGGNPMYQQNNLSQGLLVPGNMQPGGQRPMSVMSGSIAGQPFQPRPFSTHVPNGGQFGGHQSMGPGNFLAQSSQMSMHLQPGNNPGYTPSIAPSERSNIGLSARYRPVASNPHLDGISSVSSNTLQGFTAGGATSKTPPLEKQSRVSKAADTVKGILKKPGSPAIKEEDEDDWGALAKRKQNLRSKKENSGTSGGLTEWIGNGNTK